MSTPHIKDDSELLSMSHETLVFYTGEPLTEFMRTPCLVYKTLDNRYLYTPTLQEWRHNGS